MGYNLSEAKKDAVKKVRRRNRNFFLAILAIALMSAGIYVGTTDSPETGTGEENPASQVEPAAEEQTEESKDESE